MRKVNKESHDFLCPLQSLLHSCNWRELQENNRTVLMRGRDGDRGHQGLRKKRGGLRGCWSKGVLLNTNKFARVTKEQMSSLMQCVLLAQNQFFKLVLSCV